MLGNDIAPKAKGRADPLSAAFARVMPYDVNEKAPGSFFGFLSDMGSYSDNDVRRMNLRHDFIVAPFAPDIRGARVLDLAAHDGRWAYALAAAGARQVVAVEARPELVARYSEFPETPFKSRVDFRTNDIFDELELMVAAGDTFEVVALYGILYHVMDHFRLLRQVARLKPRLILIDGEFISTQNSMIQLVREKTDNVLNAVSQYGQAETAIVGIPSMGAMERMAEILGYGCDWLDWDSVPADRRRGVPDYYRTKPKCRRSCVLRPNT